MSDTITITAEEREMWASTATARINAVTPERQCEITAQERLVKALKALEQAEARAEKAEAENARLTKERDWLAHKMADTLSTDEDGRDVLTCPSRTLRPVDHNCDNITCQQCWAEADRRGVADAEREAGE